MTSKRILWLGSLGLVGLALGCGGSGAAGVAGHSGAAGGSSAAGGSGTAGGTGTAGGSGGTDDGGVPFGNSLDPDPSYTGFDGTHPYLVPLSTDVTGTITWTLSDPTIATVVTIAPAKVPTSVAFDGGQWGMLTATKAGTATLTATGSTGGTVTATVNITAYTAAQWTAGQTRWMTAPTGIIACTMCHDGAGGVDNTPTYEAFYADADLVGIMTLGQYPDGTPLIAPNHKFTLSATEQSGLVAYLRALPPKGF